MDTVPLAEHFRADQPDRYIATLYAPADKRPALAALYAFDTEIAGIRARIRARIREALPGEIRLQWWRDALDAGEPTGNPIADALIDAIRLDDLPLPAFAAYLEARIFDLYDDPVPNRNDLEGYLGETEGAVIQLASLILDGPAAAAHGALAGHAGCARGIVRILEDLPAWRARGQCLIPADMLAAAGTTAEEFVAGRAGPAADRAVEATEALARQHLAAFLRHAGELPASLRPAFLPMAMVRSRLAASRASRPAASWKMQWLSLRSAMGFWPKA